ncbi:MAG: CNNM domain-containing protein, partial [Candidatus Cloacimonadaceae bacterium]|nr:CNNM domain-containing protein [Candidatus Cloacimonadaceae bacterium]
MVLIPILVTGMLLVFLALSFLFSGYETGLISINQINLESEAKRSKSRAQLLAFVRQPDKFLGTTLIGNNIANVLLASIATYIVHDLRIPGLDARYTALFIGVIVLTFGEIMPKAIFRDHADTLVPALFPVIRFFSYIFKPFILIVTWINNSLQKMLRINGEQHFKYLTKDDLSYLLSQTSSDTITQPQIEMIEDALEFREQEARNVMVPRTDIVAIPESATITEAIEIARKEGFTRYPVFRQNLDDIVGVLIIYDVLKRDCTEN